MILCLHVVLMIVRFHDVLNTVSSYYDDDCLSLVVLMTVCLHIVLMIVCLHDVLPLVFSNSLVVCLFSVADFNPFRQFLISWSPCYFFSLSFTALLSSYNIKRILTTH